MKKILIILLTVSCFYFSLQSSAIAGLHLAYNPLYTIAKIEDKATPAADIMAYKGIAHEGEVGFAFDIIIARIIPILALSQTTLKSADKTLNPATSNISPLKDYKMGRLGYGVRVDLFGMLYAKVGGARYSLTESPAPSDNYHLNGNGIFYEGGLAMNMIPFVSLCAGVRMETATYSKSYTSSSEDTLSEPIKQKNITGLISLGLKL